jgi:hypothetical protein
VQEQVELVDQLGPQQGADQWRSMPPGWPPGSARVELRRAAALARNARERDAPCSTGPETIQPAGRDANGSDHTHVGTPVAYLPTEAEAPGVFEESIAHEHPGV